LLKLLPLLAPNECILELEISALFPDRLLVAEHEVIELTEGAMLELEPIELAR